MVGGNPCNFDVLPFSPPVHCNGVRPPHLWLTRNKHRGSRCSPSAGSPMAATKPKPTYSVLQWPCSSHDRTTCQPQAKIIAAQALGHSGKLNSPHSVIVTFFDVSPPEDPTASIALTTLMPSTTLPKTTCLPSRWVVLVVQRKNCEPLVFGPAFAMDKMPSPVCSREKFSSSNFSP